MGDDFPQEAPEGSPAVPSTPPMPSARPDELSSGTPHLLVIYGIRHSLGWQDDRKAGLSFVVARTGMKVKVKERFPLTEQGWADAWQALVQCEPGAAEAITPVLARRALHDRAAAKLSALDADTLCLMRGRDV